MSQGNARERKAKLKLTTLQQLNVNRKYHGCNIGVINDQVSVIVAGGIGSNNTQLKSVEYLSILPNKISNEDDSVKFNDTKASQDSVQFRKPHKTIANIHKNVVTANIRYIIGDGWKNLPPMQVERTHFPTIIVGTAELSVAGGKCLHEDKLNCSKIETLNSTSCEWRYNQQHLHGIRYNHNYGEMPLMLCKHNQKGCSSILKDSFVVGSEC